MINTNTFRIINRCGLHARSSALIVKLANQFQSDITLHFNGECVDGKSILGLMLLAAGEGSEVKIIANGNDSDKAVDAIGKLITSGFDEQ